MTLIEQIKDPRRPAGRPVLGLHYCSLCGKRSRTSAAVDQHQKGAHSGQGEALREPARKDMVKAIVAAEQMAEALEAIERGDDSKDRMQADIASAALAAYREATA